MLAPLVPQGSGSLALSAYATYRVKRPFWSWLGHRFDVYDATGALVAHVRHPILRLRDEFVIYTDESKTRPLATIKARQIIALHVIYDVHDPDTGRSLGALRTRGWKSIFRDTWDILDGHDQPLGILQEEGSSLLRRLFPILLGRWRIEYEGRSVGQIQQLFRFFVKEYVLDLNAAESRMDPRFGIACTLLSLMAETRRER